MRTIFFFFFYRKCRDSEIPFLSPIYDINENGSSSLINNTLLPIYIKLQCSRKELSNFKLYANGSLHRLDTNVHLLPKSYCLDHSKKAKEDVKLIVQICFEEYSYTANTVKGSWKYKLMLGGVVPSVICLILTLFAYAMLPGLRNVHGYYVMCYVACLLFAFICLFIIQWLQDELSSFMCTLFGMYTYLYMCIRFEYIYYLLIFF